LLERSGKEALAAEIMRESVRPLGIEVSADHEEAAPAAAADEDEEEADPKAKKKTKKAKKATAHNPVRHVHFSNFIIQ
jgi:flagellar protein FliL